MARENLYKQTDMFHILKTGLRFIIFWMIFFTLFRIVFFLFLLNDSGNYSWSDLPSTLLYGLRLDFSATGYLMVIPALLFGLYQFFTKPAIKQIFRIYNLLLIAICSILLSSNLFVYRSWGTLINYRALTFLNDPSAITASVSNIELFVGIGLLIIIVFLFFRLSEKIIMPAFINCRIQTPVIAFSIIVWLGSCIIMIRGGLQMLPVNESVAAFSSNQQLNHIAVNPVWHLGHNLNQVRSEKGNLYLFYDNAFADKRTKVLYDTSENLITVVKPGHPNVVIIMIESYTADIIASLGGEKGVAPNFENLIHDGLLFRRIFSSGARTDQAFVSVLSGFPAQPEKSVMRYPDKTAHLPSLSDELKKNGYFTSFYYGGDLDFSNLNSYLNNCGFQKIISGSDFNKSQLSAKWGAHDEFVLSRQLKDLNTMSQPFFSVLMTLSSHEPYDVPIPTPFNGSSLNEKYKASAWYTDRCLGNYFNEAKKQPWYANTLYIVVADHGSREPRGRSYYSHQIRYIPLVITGGALKDIYRGTVVDNTGSQHDLAATLLRQLNLDASPFVWSNNLLNINRNDFAYLCMDDAIGWVTDSSAFVYEYEPQKFIYKRPASAIPDTVTAKSFVQQLYQQFLKL